MMEQFRPHIALVEDTPSLLSMYETALENDGYDVTGIDKGQDALDYLENHKPDLLLLDLKLPDINGLDILAALKEKKFEAPVIVITGHGSINTAVNAMREGACDFLVKPFSIERLRNAVKSELEKDPTETMPPELAGFIDNKQKKSASAALVTPETKSRKDFGGFIGTSPIMQKVYEQIESAAKSNATVFITGESGTGKEVCAEAIHKHSLRADKPFIPINCAAIPRDLMESELFGHVKGAFTGAIANREGAVKLADGGTLFLDEIAEMNPDMQTKLLRFLQNLSFQKVGGSKPETTDVRIICATNRNPVEEIKTGNFREDLFYRLHVLPLYMPPLRDRGDDILDIAHTLLRSYTIEENKEFEGFSNEMDDILQNHTWPGNIRQLQNVIRNIIVMNNGRLITANMLPPDIMHNDSSFDETVTTIGTRDTAPCAANKNHPHNNHDNNKIRLLSEIERETIERAIAICGGNIPKAASALGLSPSTIYRKKTAWDKTADLSL